MNNSVESATKRYLSADWSSKNNRFPTYRSRKVPGSPTAALLYKVSDLSTILCLFRNDVFIGGMHTGNYLYPMKTVQRTSEFIDKKVNSLKCIIFSNVTGGNYKSISSHLVDAFLYVKSQS